ncbi:MAG: amidohydrolase family protein, partial [Clostridia bacterium]|nr:amidohydrolase family protein [Clostridia bacterium]
MVQMSVFSHAPVDIHSHFNHGSPFDEVNSAIPEEIHNRQLDFIKAGYDHIGVSHAGMSTYAAVEHPECVAEENRYLYDLVQQSDWLRQWVVVDPRIPETYRQAEGMLASDRVLGIKIHPDLHGYSILEHGDALFSFAAAHKAVVLMHPQHIGK